VGEWRKQLRSDPIPVLLAAAEGRPADEALAYYVRRDLLDEEVPPVEVLWDLPEPAGILRKQRDDGSWKYPGRRPHGLPGEEYAQVETYRHLRVLVGQYGFHRGHPAIGEIAGYYFARQTEEGDIRGLFGPEYAPHYMAWILELLVKAGYEDDLPIERGFTWLLAMRQDDGGWAFPIRTAGISYYEAHESPEPTQPNRSRPFSHVLTGGVLRAFAAHPRYRWAPEARAAAELLKSRFFLPDTYPDRRGAQYWTKFQFPFWWPNLLTALDSLSLMGYPAGDGAVGQGLDWFLSNQGEDGLWKTGFKETGTAKSRQARLWVALAVCRVLRRFLEAEDQARVSDWEASESTSPGREPVALQEFAFSVQHR
jgi:hypothetical protein